MQIELNVCVEADRGIRTRNPEGTRLGAGRDRLFSVCAVWNCSSFFASSAMRYAFFASDAWSRRDSSCSFWTSSAHDAGTASHNRERNTHKLLTLIMYQTRSKCGNDVSVGVLAAP